MSLLTEAAMLSVLSRHSANQSIPRPRAHNCTFSVFTIENRRLTFKKMVYYVMDLPGRVRNWFGRHLMVAWLGAERRRRAVATVGGARLTGTPTQYTTDWNLEIHSGIAS